MIKETTRKIYFTSYLPEKGRKKDDSGPVIVKVDLKYSMIIFNRQPIQEMDMDGKFIRFYYEVERKIIGWKITDKLSDGELKTKDYRLVKQNKTTYQYKASIAAILAQMKGLQEKSYKCEVKRYREMSDILTKGETYYYIQLKNNEEKDSEADS